MRLKTKIIDRIASPELLPAREAVRAASGVAFGVFTRARRGLSRGLIPGLLSVVVPVYNVERHLAQCLNSLLRQNYRRLEIVVVDDGSPDGSYEVARGIARRDPRVRIVRQANGGLSAARNTGVRHARGEYLAFLDSDDFVDRHPYAEAIASLRRSGSDFAVLPYRREKNGDFPPAAPWIREAHRQDRTATTLAEFPDIMVNAVAWSKVYRRAFWDEHGFVFPVGMLYEDQAVSMAAFAAAGAFDVMSHIGINWRMRSDQSSITQQVTTPRNIEHHRIAVRDSLDRLREYGADAAARQRALQIFNNNMGEFLPNIRQMTGEAREQLRRFLELLSGEMAGSMWDEVESRMKVLTALCVQQEWDLALRFLAEGGWNRDHFGGEVAGSRIRAELPLAGELSAVVPEHAFWFSSGETALSCVWRRIRRSAQAWEIDLFAHVNHMRMDVEEYELDAALVEPGGTEVPIAVERRRSHLDALGHTRRYADMSVAALTVIVPAGLLATPGEYRLRLGISAGELRRSGIAKLDAHSEFALPEDAEDGACSVACEGIVDDEARISVRSIDVRVEEASFSGRAIELSFVSGLSPERVRLVRADDRFSVSRAEARVIPGSGPRASARLELPPLPAGERGPVEYELEFAAGDGARLHAALDAPRTEAPDGSIVLATRLHTTPAEQLALRRQLIAKKGIAARPHPRSGRLLVADVADAVLITDVEFAEREIRITARDEGGDPLDRLQARAGSTDYDATVTRTEEAGGAVLQLRISLMQPRWGLGPLGLASGLYRLRGWRRSGRACRFYLSEAVVRKLGEIVALESGRFSLERSPRNLLRFRVAPALRDDEIGLGDRLRLRDRAAALAPAGPRRSILFRNLYGEAANDSALAVHRELQRRGADVELVWAAKDASVPVPEGARVVIEESEEFYRAFATADVVMVNVHQPIWYRKSEGQLLIQTFHGYPFKLAGRRWWERRGVGAEHVESYFRRAEEWDYLVSPARYATPLLAEFFRDDRQIESRVLEIGYPRNDVLQSAEAGALRADTRARLGIPDGAKAILYAPTFRDYLSADDMTAELVDHLDFDAFLRELGPGYVLLLRGHPFNARVGTSASSAIVNVTDYPDINHLILASDMAILDYSSLRFDYALTAKPMFFLVPDMERYFEARESFIPYAETSPGPKLRSQAELIGGIRRAESIRAEHEPERREFIARYMELDDGHAAARLVDVILDELKERGQA
ncbi:bifunctional glycosyltransferase/CDP-glycerol:glycerophosphate glycerophosphotransferase [Leucobacter massiliensis]|uniref:bifunctional glycosyltransferase/CDP-glycerol:glycerophosphate glycerophosphotransferase n=1 Tax=Leucobacter massiliensis TaxID=1686285 RepID=UPI0015E3C455|nr:CDP-glycerol glycerophosphotransferase family protein [Leucobacter massiliensis]